MHKCFFISVLVLSSFGCSHVPSRQPIWQREPSQAALENPGVANEDHPERFNRVVVCSDTHGMYQQIVNNLKAGRIIDSEGHWMTGDEGKTLLVITGDSIDKGPQSLEVLDLWIRLQVEADANGGRLIHVLGNHEAEFLAHPENDHKAGALMAELTAASVSPTELTTTTGHYGQFLYSEPLAAKVGLWVFSHSGYYPHMDWTEFSKQAQVTLAKHAYGDDFITGPESILEKKKWEKREDTVTNVLQSLDEAKIFGLVFGHQPKAFRIEGHSAAISTVGRVAVGGRLIKIDNGMPPEAGTHPGSLLVFTNPAQMNAAAYPDLKVIAADGSEKALVPEAAAAKGGKHHKGDDDSSDEEP